MPTVPNWIAKAVIYEIYDYGKSAHVIETTGWRATKTQIVVTCAGSRGPIERRFRLEDLGEVGRRGSWPSGTARLMDPADAAVTDARRDMVRRAAVSDLKTVIGKTRLDPSAMDAEALAVAIGRIQRAATKALADLADVL